MLTRRLNPEQMFKQGRLDEVRIGVGHKRRVVGQDPPDRRRMRYGQPEGLAPTLPECPSPSVTQACARRQGDCAPRTYVTRLRIPLLIREERRLLPWRLKDRRSWGSTSVPSAGGGLKEEQAHSCGKHRKRPAAENEASAFPRYRSGILPG